MQKSVQFILTVLVLGSFLLSACAGAAPQGDDSGDDLGANSNEVIDVDGDVNDNSSDANENADDAQENENDNANDDGNASGDDLEFNGVVDAFSDTSITINGVVYNFADFTEFNDVVSVGDQVKIHFIVNADGSFTIREIELSSGDDDNNSNGNSNSNDDDDNSNDNSNDDDSNDSGDDHKNSNDNSNDDDKGNDNGNDD